jgi:hypothetical protein
MPLLGAIGNASKHSFRGNYDNYPFDIDFGDLVNVQPGKIYKTSFKLIEDINYKVPLTISGDGEYYIGDSSFSKTFDNSITSFDQTPTTFDADFPELDYSTQPTYVRNGDIVSLRVIGIPPVKVEESTFFVDRNSNEIEISLLNPINFVLRSGNYSFNPNGQAIIEDKQSQQENYIPPEYYGKTYTTNVTIGKKEFVWKVTTQNASLAQNFSFPPLTNVFTNTSVISEPYIVTGLSENFNYEADIITTTGNGTLSVNYGPFLKKVSVKNGDNLRVRATSSTDTDTELSIGVRISLNQTTSQSITYWSVKTLDNVPSNLNTLQNATNCELETGIFSNKITISGLSPNIDFNISITNGDGLLSVNDRQYTKSDKIRNGNTLQLFTRSSYIWEDEKEITVTIENTSHTWKVTNRTIRVNKDLYASFLCFALPLEYYSALDYESGKNRIPDDVTEEIKFLSTGRSETTEPPSIITGSNTYQSFQNEIPLESRISKYYTHSYQLEKEATQTKKTNELSYFNLKTKPYYALRANDFTLQFWFRTSGFDFNGTPGLSIIRPQYFESKDQDKYVPIVYLKGDNWQNSNGFKRGLLFGYVDQQTGQSKTIVETNEQVFRENVWHHVAVVKSSGLYIILIDGVRRASATLTTQIDFTGYIYDFFRTDGLVKLYNQNTYFQDFRLYNNAYVLGLNSINEFKRYDPTSIVPILERYKDSAEDINPLSDLYYDSQGRALIFSTNTALKDPRTLSKTTSKVLPGTDSCIDDVRWKQILALVENDTSTTGYRLAIQSNNLTFIAKATDRNLYKLIKSNRFTLRESLTEWTDFYTASNSSFKIDVKGSDGSFTTIDFNNLSSYSNFKTGVEYTLTSYTDIPTRLYAVGGGGGSSTTKGARGGSGGFAQGDFTFVAGKSYKLKVGGGGFRVFQGSGSFTASGGYNGGGFGGNRSGSGGGYTGIFDESITHENAILIAGGGGGGSDDPATGGSGGGESGGNGSNYYSRRGGSGGTQTAGGAGFQSGEKLNGGDGSSQGGAGGGGGYYGGGSGLSFFSVFAYGAGGGGSGYLHPTLITNGSYNSTGVVSGGSAGEYSNGGSGTFKIELKSSIISSSFLILSWDENEGFNGTGLDYSGLSWRSDLGGFGYYLDSTNKPFESSKLTYSITYPTAKWWILPPGVPDFS